MVGRAFHTPFGGSKPVLSLTHGTGTKVPDYEQGFARSRALERPFSSRGHPSWAFGTPWRPIMVGVFHAPFFEA